MTHINITSCLVSISHFSLFDRPSNCLKSTRYNAHEPRRETQFLEGCGSFFERGAMDVGIYKLTRIHTEPNFGLLLTGPSRPFDLNLFVG